MDQCLMCGPFVIISTGLKSLLDRSMNFFL